MGLKLLVEEPVFDIDYIIEEKNKDEPRNLYIKGPYLMAEKKNKNGRVYKIDEMKKEVDRFLKEMIDQNRALGELNHPTSVEVNPERACHKIIEMKQDGNMFIGKSKVLSTPMGQIVRSLMADNVRLGISSRALGKLTENGGQNDVSDFHLICCDIVHDPSVPDAFVNGIFESKEWIIAHDGSIEEAYEKLENKLENLPKKDIDNFLRDQIIEFIKSIK